MEEGEYRQTYHEVNPRRCVFEKGILSRQTMCEYAHRFCLADREGVACQLSPARLQCEELLGQLRAKAIFALRLTRSDGPLPHAKEVKLQIGGVLGLIQILANNGIGDIGKNNIHGLIEHAKLKYGGIDLLPYDEITRQIVQYQGRSRGRRNKRE